MLSRTKVFDELRGTGHTRCLHELCGLRSLRCYSVLCGEFALELSRLQSVTIGLLDHLIWAHDAPRLLKHGETLAGGLEGLTRFRKVHLNVRRCFDDQIGLSIDKRAVRNRAIQRVLFLGFCSNSKLKRFGCVFGDFIYGWTSVLTGGHPASLLLLRSRRVGLLISVLALLSYVVGLQIARYRRAQVFIIAYHSPCPCSSSILRDMIHV